jgi:hypothetical protein
LHAAHSAVRVARMTHFVSLLRRSHGLLIVMLDIPLVRVQAAIGGPRFVPFIAACLEPLAYYGCTRPHVSCVASYLSCCIIFTEKPSAALVCRLAQVVYYPYPAAARRSRMWRSPIPPQDGCAWQRRPIGSEVDWGGGVQEGGVVIIDGGSVRFKGGSIARSSAVRGPRCRQLCVSHGVAWCVVHVATYAAHHACMFDVT